jgi:GNAT superfamily N-acetyltransferase
MAAVERAVARNLAEYVAAVSVEVPGLGATSVAVGGGVAAFTGAGSPLTTVKGAHGLAAHDLDAIESFFRDRGHTAATVELAPWPDDGTALLLAARGYQAAEREDVVTAVAPVTALRVPGTPLVEVVGLDAWPDLVRGSYEDEEGSPTWSLVVASARLADIRIVGVRAEGHWVGGAQSVPYGEVVIFGNDGTHPDHRGRGIQRALIEDRLTTVPAGAIVAAEVAPGSQSERNYLRCGFRLGYTRDLYVCELR